MLQQPPLPFDSTRIARQLSVRPNHPVTWHDDCQRVAPVGATHRTNRPWRTHCGGLFAIGHRRAERDRAQHPPRGHLKRCALWRESELEGASTPREVVTQLSLRSIEMNVRHRLLGRDSPIDERDSCEAGHRRREFDRTERRGNDPCDFLHMIVLADRIARGQQRRQL
jgi:hypothetical protein